MQLLEWLLDANAIGADAIIRSVALAELRTYAAPPSGTDPDGTHAGAGTPRRRIHLSPWFADARLSAPAEGEGGTKASEVEMETLAALGTCVDQRCLCRASGALPHLVRVPAAVDASEAAAIRELGATLGGTQRRTFGYGGGRAGGSGARTGDASADLGNGHSVTFLHSAFESELPELFARFRRLALEADANATWGRLDANRLTARTVELLQYHEPADSLGWHIDPQSAVTMLLMLSADGAYAGAALEHESDGVVHRARPTQHEALFYRSDQEHRVTPLESGTRVALALEWWHEQGVDLKHTFRNHRPFATGPSTCPR